jgi:hypothetical protein
LQRARQGRQLRLVFGRDAALVCEQPCRHLQSGSPWHHNPGQHARAHAAADTPVQCGKPYDFQPRPARRVRRHLRPWDLRPQQLAARGGAVAEAQLVQQAEEDRVTLPHPRLFSAAGHQLPWQGTSCPASSFSKT